MAVFISNHPLVRHKIGLMRTINLPARDSRALASELAALLLYEATVDLPTEGKSRICWSGVIETRHLSCQLTLAPILRAGLGMLPGCQQMLPDASVSVIGLYRDESTLKAHKYYVKIDKPKHGAWAVILDPMLATGGSAIYAVEMLKEAGYDKILMICLVAAPEGVERMGLTHPDVDIFVAAQDERLNEQGYILPGLGDAGDRIFGTC